MIKFILHGGRTSQESISNTKFFEELLKSDKKPLKFLLVYFAKPEDLWQEMGFVDMNRIQGINQSKQIEFMVASSEDFEGQIEWADVLFFKGGDGSRIIKPLKKIKNWKELLDGKTVAGSSAGTNVWSTYYYDNDTDKIEKGLGVLPIKTFCHFGVGNSYKKDFEPELQKLMAVDNDGFETIVLREGEYTEIVMNGPKELEDVIK